MPNEKKKSKFDQITWIITGIIIGILGAIYGLYGLIKADQHLIILYSIIAIVGSILLLIAVTQIIIIKRKEKKEAKIERCPKCGAKVFKGDEHCRKCGYKLK